MAVSSSQYLPPPGPPPLLTAEQILALAQQGHMPLPIPPSLQHSYDQLFDLLSSDVFTSNISQDQKSALYPTHPRSEETGYRQVQGEKEFITFRHLDTQSPSPPTTSSSDDLSALRTRINALVTTTWSTTASLLHRVLYDLARAMGSLDPEHLWSPLLTSTHLPPPTFTDDSVTFLRTFRYEPHSGISDQHTDLGLLTLCVCRGRGLQVRSPPPSSRQNKSETTAPNDSASEESDSWSDASTPHPTLLIGTTLASLLRSRVRPGVHRVLANPEGRYSAVFALRPYLGCTLDLRMFGHPDAGDGGGLHVNSNSNEHENGNRNGISDENKNEINMRTYWRALMGNRYNVNASGDVRTAQKEKMMRRNRLGHDPLQRESGLSQAEDARRVEDIA